MVDLAQFAERQRLVAQAVKIRPATARWDWSIKVIDDSKTVNAWAMALARRHRMLEVFGTARMYLGEPPRVAESRIYGVTTFELG